MGNLQCIAGHIARMIFSAGHISGLRTRPIFNRVRVIFASPSSENFVFRVPVRQKWSSSASSSSQPCHFYISFAKRKKFLWKFSGEQKKGHHVRRSPIFRPKSSKEQKKVITPAGRSLSCVTVFWHDFIVQYAEMLKRKTYGKPSITWTVCTHGPHL